MAITRQAHWLYFKEADEFFLLIIEKITDTVQKKAFSEISVKRELLAGNIESRKQAKILSNKLTLHLVVTQVCLIFVIKNFDVMRLN